MSQITKEQLLDLFPDNKIELLKEDFDFLDAIPSKDCTIDEVIDLRGFIDQYIEPYECPIQKSVQRILSKTNYTDYATRCSLTFLKIEGLVDVKLSIKGEIENVAQCALDILNNKRTFIKITEP
jgi:hypothetical protein